MQNRIIVYYDEIALKGKNRRRFEDALVKNLRNVLADMPVTVTKQYGRLVCIVEEEVDSAEVTRRLSVTPGIARFALGVRAPRDLDAIKETARHLFADRLFATFGVKCRRSDKSFPIDSTTISAAVGGFLKATFEKKVDLENPDLRLLIEITHTDAFLYLSRHAGPGGLPVGVGGKLLVSLSGGIDSPVAAYMMMKRGCEMTFVHIRNETQFAQDAEEKIDLLVETLTRVQGRSTLYVVPFGELQRSIIAMVPAKYRMIIYRRFMMRILNTLAVREKAKGFVTGDSMGQVASQTIDNMRCIHTAADYPVFAPLIGLNKEETIQIARRIGTFEHSILPYPDCCSFMLAKHPETRGNLGEIEHLEERLEGVDELVEAAINNAVIRRFKFPPRKAETTED